LCGESVIAWFIRLRAQPSDRLAFWGECWPKRHKARCYTCGRVCRDPTAWVGAPCVRAAPTDTPCVGGLVQQLVSEAGWSSAFSDKSRLTMCEGEIVGNSTTLCGESVIAWFIRLRAQPSDRLAFWGECWPKRPKARCYTCGRVCRDPTAWVGAPCVRAAPTDTSCVGGPVQQLHDVKADGLPVELEQRGRILASNRLSLSGVQFTRSVPNFPLLSARGASRRARHKRWASQPHAHDDSQGPSGGGHGWKQRR
jgi:hypothetical protein